MDEQKARKYTLPIILLLIIIASVIVFIFINSCDDSNNPTRRPTYNYDSEIELGDVDDYVDYLAANQDGNWLNYFTVKIYNAFYDNIDAIKAGADSISLSECGWSTSELNEVLDYIAEASSGALSCLIFDNPEFFWLSFDQMMIETYTSSVFSSEITDIVFSVENDFIDDHFSGTTAVNNAITQMQNARQEIYSGMPEGLNDYQKVVYLNDYLVDNVEYDLSLNQSFVHTAYGALVNGLAVCDGYSYALEYLLDGLGITNLVGAGYVADGISEPEGHMWSYVYLYGNWYGVDTTWNDPVITDDYFEIYYPYFSEEEREQYRQEYVEENCHNYLLKGGNLSTHSGFYAEGRTAENYIYYFGDSYYQFPVPKISTSDFEFPVIYSVTNTDIMEGGEKVGERVSITASGVLDNYTFTYAVSTNGGASYSEYIPCNFITDFTDAEDSGLYKFRLQTDDGEVILEWEETIDVTIDSQEAINIIELDVYKEESQEIA